MFKLIPLLIFLLSCDPTKFTEETKGDFVFEDEISRTPSAYKERSQFRQPILKNRFYISSVFKDVFGPSYNRNNIVQNSILINQGIFGSGCDIYTNSRTGARSLTLEFVDKHCFNSNVNSKSSQNSTTLREGWRIRVCEKIIGENEDAVNYALDKANIAGESAVTYDNINSVYQLFYPLDDIDLETSKILIAAGRDGPSTDYWKRNLLIMCLSPGWQNL